MSGNNNTSNTTSNNNNNNDNTTTNNSNSNNNGMIFWCIDLKMELKDDLKTDSINGNDELT